jgi:pantoate--beta-alanine ligase
MRAAREETDLVVVSLFVNPLQFAPGEDLAAYPRDLDGDASQALGEGVNVLFAPSADEMYAGSPRTTVHVEGLTTGLCGAARPTHFDGVTTIVTKLLSIVGPCRAYFGRKDAQQLAVVRRMASDLNLPVEIVGCPLVRDPDGVALSSRNAYLDADERRAASALWRALTTAADEVVGGERDPSRVRQVLNEVLAREPLIQPEYAEVVDATDFGLVSRIEGDVVVAVAAFCGRTRLIDNVGVSITSRGVVVDLGVVVQPSEVSCVES